jgi:hypothetical protein
MRSHKRFLCSGLKQPYRASVTQKATWSGCALSLPVSIRGFGLGSTRPSKTTRHVRPRDQPGVRPGTKKMHRFSDPQRRS